MGAPVPAWNGGTALARETSLSLGSAVTSCLLLCGGVCEAAGSIAFGFCGFVLSALKVFFHFSKVALLLRDPLHFERGEYIMGLPYVSPEVTF